MIVEESVTLKERWRSYLNDKRFKYVLLSGLIILFTLLSFLPSFFQFIERRQGLVITDPLLNRISPTDVSIPIFILIWTTAVIGIATAVKNPKLFIQLLYCYITFTIIRNACVFLVPLNTPPGLIVLKDPLANSFYGATFITKDLFFSGHTSTLLLMGFWHTNKIKKLYSICSAILVGILVLVQHVHYTIDVIFAFPITYICYLAAMKIVKFWLSF